MKNRCFTILLLSLFTAVTDLFATNDTIYGSQYYICDFEKSEDINPWQIKNSSGANKWIIGTFDGSNHCLYISNNAQDTGYSKKSSSISVAYKTVELSDADTIILECDIMVGGEGSKDYLKVMLVDADFELDIPAPNSSNLKFAGPYYRDSSFVFPNNSVYISETQGQEHVIAKLHNNFPLSSAKLLFIWRNDNSSGTMPGAIVDNIVLGGSVTKIEKNLCKGEYFYAGKRAVNQTGVYYDTVTVTENTDCYIRYDIAVHDTFVVFKDVSICKGETYVLNDGTLALTSGFYVDRLQTINGCDSVVNINLSVNDVYDTLILDTICSSEVYAKYGFNIDTEGYYSDTLKNRYGCDSIINLLLVVNDTYEKIYIESICTGDTFTRYGFNETESGFYTHNLKSVNGCDSIVHLNLKVSDAVYKNIYDTICFGEKYSQYGFVAEQSGIYTDSLQTLSGCDSIVILYLTVNPTNIQLDTDDIREICQGESVEFCGKTLTTSGHYEEKMQNIYGCDSIMRMTLVVNPVYWITDSVTIKNGEQYRWNGRTYSQQGTYTDTLTSIKGCDSIVTLCLTVSSSYDNTLLPVDIELYPNPASVKINIKLQPSANKRFISFITESRIELKRKEMPAGSTEIQIDVIDLPKGIYILQIHGEDKIYSRPLIVQ